MANETRPLPPLQPTPPLPLDRPGTWLGLLLAIAITWSVAGISGFATASAIDSWYATLNRPAFAPPNWVFGPVWTVLYTTMAIAAWLVWRNAGTFDAAATPLRWFAIQLAFNFAWSFLFFYFQRPAFALVDIILLWLAILVTTWQFKRWSIVATLLMIPYLLWVTFAAALNFEFVRLNP